MRLDGWSNPPPKLLKMTELDWAKPGVRTDFMIFGGF